MTQLNNFIDNYCKAMLSLMQEGYTRSEAVAILQRCYSPRTS